MRWLWVLPMLASACAPLPQYSGVPLRVYTLKASDTENCGTPDEFKPCRALIWAPPPRIPVYAVQLDNIPGDIPIGETSARESANYSDEP